MSELYKLKSALLCYRLSLIFPKKWFDTHKSFDEFFPNRKVPLELSKLKKNYRYWFPSGKLLPRIKLLKIAIKNEINKLDNETN